MCHDMDDPMALHHPIPRCQSHHVAGLYTQVRIDLQVHVDCHQIAHLACAHIMDGPYARCARERGDDRLSFLLVNRAVHQIVQCIPAKTPAHTGDHEAHNQGGNRVEDGVTREVAHNAQAHDQ